MNTNDYNRCVEKYADGLFRFAQSMLHDRMGAEDVIQQVFEKFWLKCKEVDAEKGRSYLFTSTYRACIDQIRHRKRYVDGENIILPGEERDSHSFEIRDAVQQALQQLPEIQRTLVLLRDYEGYRYDEMAEICSLSESQVKVYLFRARKKLQSLLAHLKYA